jgi:hypothetical protein
MFIITPDMGEPGDRSQDRLFASFRCECGYHARATLLNWNTRKLYCAAFETKDSEGETVPNKEYMHAESEEEAKTNFWASHSPLSVHLVGIAPVVGYYALDKAERKLTV